MIGYYLHLIDWQKLEKNDATYKLQVYGEKVLSCISGIKWQTLLERNLAISIKIKNKLYFNSSVPLLKI